MTRPLLIEGRAELRNDRGDSIRPHAAQHAVHDCRADNHAVGNRRDLDCLIWGANPHANQNRLVRDGLQPRGDVHR